MNPALNSTNRNDHTTPTYFLDLVRKVGAITYDPASQKDNPTKAQISYSYQDAEGRSWTAATDRSRQPSEGGGLVQLWPTRGLTFVNPPYGRHLGGPVDETAEIRRSQECRYLYEDDHARLCPHCVDPKTGRITGRVSIRVGTGTGWARKMAQHRGEGLYLVACRPDSGWFKRLHRWCAWRLDWSSPSLGHRLKFGGSKDSAPFPSTVFYRGPNVSGFLDVFGPHGTLIPGVETQKVLLDAAMGRV